MNRRWLAGALAVALWLVLAVLWLAWAVLLAVAWLAASRKRQRRAIARAIPRFPSPARILAWLPGRPHPVRYARTRRQPADGPSRMSSLEVAEMRGYLRARDGGCCQNCGVTLVFDAHHLHPRHPEVHHLVAWSKAKYEWWCDHPVNLVLTCGEPCNRGIGTGTTPRLEAKRAANLRYYRFDQPGRAA